MGKKNPHMLLNVGGCLCLWATWTWKGIGVDDVDTFSKEIDRLTKENDVYLSNGNILKNKHKVTLISSDNNTHKIK